MYYTKARSGFTLIEILIAVAILGMMAGISLAAFTSFSRKEALQGNASALVAGFRDARSRTLAAVNGSSYGVHIDEDRFTLFQGSVFSSSAPSNEPFFLSSAVRASSSISSFVFEKLTGDSSASGTIDVYLVSDPANKKLIRVESTGLIHLE